MTCFRVLDVWNERRYWGERRDIADETFEVVEKFRLAAVNGSSVIDAASLVTDFSGAEGGSRTRTSLRTTDFKSFEIGIT